MKLAETCDDAQQVTRSAPPERQNQVIKPVAEAEFLLEGVGI